MGLTRAYGVQSFVVGDFVAFGQLEDRGALFGWPEVGVDRNTIVSGGLDSELGWI
jgi:hypothetical protein